LVSQASFSHSFVTSNGEKDCQHDRKNHLFDGLGRQHEVLLWFNGGLEFASQIEERPIHRQTIIQRTIRSGFNTPGARRLSTVRSPTPTLKTAIPKPQHLRLCLGFVRNFRPTG